MEADFEAELQQQLTEQEEAVVGVQQLLAAEPASTELAELLSELQAARQATEESLLGLKRQRLLGELDALHGGGDAQEQGQQQAGGGGGGDSAPGLPPGGACIFRHTDGRHYFGRVLPGSTAAATQLEFMFPTR